MLRATVHTSWLAFLPRPVLLGVAGYATLVNMPFSLIERATRSLGTACRHLSSEIDAVIARRNAVNLTIAANDEETFTEEDEIEVALMMAEIDREMARAVKRKSGLYRKREFPKELQKT